MNQVKLPLQLRVKLFQSLISIIQSIKRSIENDLKVDINLFISNINMLNNKKILE